MSEIKAEKRLANSQGIRVVTFNVSTCHRRSDAQTQRRSMRKATPTESDTDAVKSRTVRHHSATFDADLHRPAEDDHALSTQKVHLANTRGLWCRAAKTRLSNQALATRVRPLRHSAQFHRSMINGLSSANQSQTGEEIQALPEVRKTGRRQGSLQDVPQGAGQELSACASSAMAIEPPG